MLSIIICSVNKERLADIEKNIADTIGDGVKYEVIAIDNTVRKASITTVYNEGARIAKYPCMLFVHEDVRFLENNWFERIALKLSEPDCGIIGFAGSRAKVRTPSGWYQDKKWNVMNYYQMFNGRLRHARTRSFHDTDFREVVVLDGFAFFVKREVWLETPFDDKLLTGFHCYDIDFSLSVARKYRNYVCGNVAVEHFSSGNFDEKWLRDTLKLHYEKWEPYLPMTVNDDKEPITPADIKRVDEHAVFRLIRQIKGIDDIPRMPFVLQLLRYRLSFNHIGHIIRSII